MDKKDAIEEAYDKMKEKHGKDFKSEVEHLVWDIENTSNELRDLKKRLAELEYKEPEITGGIL